MSLITCKKLRGGGKTLNYLLTGVIAFAASQTMLAEKAYWKGYVDSNWGEPKNWDWETTPSNRDLPTNDEMFFNRDGTYTNNEVVFTNACINNWRTFVNGVGTAETPLVFRATSSDYGLRFGNQNWKNPSCIGDSDDAYLCLKSGTWSATYLKLDNTAQLTLTDGALLSVDNDTILEKGNCKVSVTGGARFYTAAYFAHKAGEVKVENGTLEVSSQNYEFGANAAANLLLNEGGLLIVREIEKKTHGGTISFNGGILRSNRGSENLVDENIAVTVGAKGGTIDNNGKDVIIQSAISGQGGMKFKGGGKVTLNKVNAYMGETKIAIRTQLVVNSAELERMLKNENGGIMVVMPEGVSAKGTFKLLGKSNGSCTAAEYALITKDAGLEGAVFAIDEDGDITVTVSHTPQTWAGSAETSAPWSGNNWDSSVAFEDGNDAVFATDGAIAEVDEDFSAYTLTFNGNAALTGTGTLTVPTIAVADGKTASIAGPLAGSMEKTGAGTLTLGSSRADTTTLTEGMLVANAPVGTLVLGTAAEKPVTFDYGGQSYSTSLADIDDGVNVTLTNGTFKIGFVKNGSLTIAADTIITRSGDIVVGQSTETGILTMNGGVVSCSGKTYIGDTAGGKGDVKVIAGDLIISDDLRIGNKGEGTLTIKGGTVEVGSSEHQKWIYVGYDNGSTGVINLDGGQLKLWHVRKRNGTGAINLNGGKLVANGVSDDGLIDSKLSLTVGSNGGTIDANGHAITIATSIAGDGGMCYQGGGKVTLTAQPTYMGLTTVEVGTTLVIPEAIAHEKLAFSVPGELADGVYTVVSFSSGDSQFADNVVDGKEGFVLSGDKKSILCIYGNPQNTWIGGASGSLSDAEGWSLGFVPTSGDSCVINNALAASLAVGDTFAPSAITFGESSAAVTINGGELSNITKIENRSNVRHVFNCAVSGNEIDFRNTSHCCEFRGGITVAKPVFSNSPTTANARAIVGDWTITSDWSPVSYNELGRNDAIGSSVTVQGELQNPNNIVIYSGSVVTAATMKAESSTYPAYTNNGRLVIAGMVDISSTSGDFCLARTDDENATIIAGGIVYNTGNWPWLNAKTLVLGADGINFDSSHNNNLRFSGTPTLYARDAATTLHAGKDDRQAYTIDNGKTLTVCTTQFDSSEPSTITIDGKIVGKYNNNHTGGMAVTGCGTLVFNSVSTFTGGLSVGGTATVKVNEGCTPGSGTVTLGAGTTLALTAESREFTPLANTLNLPTEGTATIRIDGKRLRSGEHVIATIGNDATTANVAFDGNSAALAGRKATLRVEEGKLILNIASDGTVIIVR